MKSNFTATKVKFMSSQPALSSDARTFPPVATPKSKVKYMLSIGAPPLPQTHSPQTSYSIGTTDVVFRDSQKIRTNSDCEHDGKMPAYQLVLSHPIRRTYMPSHSVPRQLVTKERHNKNPPPLLLSPTLPQLSQKWIGIHPITQS